MAKTAIIGLKDVHVGIFTGEGQAYRDITPIAGALEAKITVSESTTQFYCDDSIADVTNALESVEIELSLAGLSLDEQALLLGERVVNGSIASSVNDLATRPYLGLAFRSEKSNGAYRYVSIPKIKFSPSDYEAKTKEDKAEYATIKVVGNAIPLDNSGVYKVTADSDADGIDEEWLGTFLTTIPQASKAE